MIASTKAGFEDSISVRRALVLIVDPQASTRHWMWRLLSRAFGVLEAQNAVAARRWIDERPDIDALIVEDDLPGSRGSELVKELARMEHPIASRSIVIASEWRRVMLSGMNVVERGDMQTILALLTGWFVPSDSVYKQRPARRLASQAPSRVLNQAPPTS